MKTHHEQQREMNVTRLINDLGGVAKVAEITGKHRTAPYGWMKRNYIGSDVMAMIKASRPDIDLNDYFEEEAENGHTERGTGIPGEGVVGDPDQPGDQAPDH